MRSTETACRRGEFLLMLLVAVAIVGILAGILAPVLANKLDDARLRSEAETLRSLRKDFEATYDAVDYNNLNEASVAASGLPPGTVFTTFDQGTQIAARIYAQNVVVDPAGWVTKLAQKRGVSSFVVGASYSALTQNQYTAIAFNAYQVQRCLVIGPAGEPGQQPTPPRPSTQSGTKAGNRCSPRLPRCGARCSRPARIPFGTPHRRTAGRTPRDCWSSGSCSQSTR